MEDVVKLMTALCDFFPGADQPLEYYDDEYYVSINIRILFELIYSFTIVRVCCRAQSSRRCIVSTKRNIINFSRFLYFVLRWK